MYFIYKIEFRDDNLTQSQLFIVDRVKIRKMDTDVYSDNYL